MASITLTTKQKRKIELAIKALNEVRAEIQQENPDNYINWYLEDNDNLNLLEDVSHNHDSRGSSNQDAVIATFDLKHSTGGGW